MRIARSSSLAACVYFTGPPGITWARELQLLSSFTLRGFILFAVNLVLLKAAGTLPPQIGGFYVFVCARQRSEQFLLLQPQQAEAALALPWSHSQGQIPTDLPHGWNCTSCLRQVTPTFSFSSLRRITHPRSPILRRVIPTHISRLGQVPPTLSSQCLQGCSWIYLPSPAVGSSSIQAHLESPAS